MAIVDKVSPHQEILHIEYENLYKKIILGNLYGVGLRQRGIDDNHVCFDILSDDDGYWKVREGGSSSSWFDDLILVVQKAQKWCEENSEPYIYHGQQYGWKFK